MNSNKYANLPDIDTAQDIYETDDVFPSSQTKDESSDEEAVASRSAIRGPKNGDVPASKEEMDVTNLMSSEEATRRFRRAERKTERLMTTRTFYTHPPSPTSPTTPSHVPPLSKRLRMIEAEVAALEAEASDPSNPQLLAEEQAGTVDPGELVRGLADVRGRLERIHKGREGRGRLVGAILDPPLPLDTPTSSAVKQEGKPDTVKPLESKDVAEFDYRVGKLEKLVGSSGAALDEASPLPPPLLPMLARLNAQLTLLTQPRHIDSVSRRLKLLLSDLERVSTSQHGPNSHGQRRQSNQHQSSTQPPPSALQEQLAPLLTRLAPSLPHIPHILTRLRTLSTLHASAGSFQATLETMEEEQKRTRLALDELNQALNGVERSLNDNDKLIKGNVTGLEDRIELLTKRVEEVDR